MDAASVALIALISVCTRLYLDSIIQDFRCTSTRCQYATYVTMTCSHISNAVLLATLFLHSLISAALVGIQSAPTTVASQLLNSSSCWLI